MQHHYGVSWYLHPDMELTKQNPGIAVGNCITQDSLGFVIEKG